MPYRINPTSNRDIDADTHKRAGVYRDMLNEIKGTINRLRNGSNCFGVI
jgi:hypothetical protein